jgi:CRP-like cAMP-binding protein
MSLEDDVRTLARNPALAELDSEALRLLAFSAETRILRAGDVIFRRNDPADGGIFILSGSVALDGGGKTSTIFGPGALLGDIALLAETRRPATAIAREPSSVLKISRALFHRVLEEFPANAVRMQRNLYERIHRLGNELDSVRWSHFSDLGED